jgi:hypothetical protein
VVGRQLGPALGRVVGTEEGAALGWGVGEPGVYVGTPVGRIDGTAVGSVVGLAVVTEVGARDGALVTVTLGLDDGAVVGPGVGTPGRYVGAGDGATLGTCAVGTVVGILVATRDTGDETRIDTADEVTRDTCGPDTRNDTSVTLGEIVG